jgi:murein DD-endopeptidase MepM/ murein hydrolase activator NlpD
LAENTPSVGDAPEQEPTGMTRRSRARVARPSSRPVTPRNTAVATRPPRADRPKRGVAKPVRSVAILSIVAGLVATVAIPAYAAWQPTAEAKTLQQASAGDAQSMVVASEASAAQLDRSSYSATTSEEIAKKKAAEAAAERARQRAAQSVSLSSVDLSMVSPGSGEVRWPVVGFKKGRGLGDSGYHQGVDLLLACGQPVYAAAAGVVRVSQESFGGYGVAITIDHVINGQRVSTLYGHMTYGSRVVQSGETVAAGQLIGLIGSTGSSTACHTHFEVRINGSVVDPWAWLEQNAG